MSENELAELNKFMGDKKYLPTFMKDFHDQKDIFKAMHELYETNNADNPREEMPNWRDGHCYVIDWFLWYIAQRGYTLQKNRTKIKFREFTAPKSKEEDFNFLTNIIKENYECK